MRAAKKIAAIAIAAMCIHLLISSGSLGQMRERLIAAITARHEAATREALNSAPLLTPDSEGGTLGVSVSPAPAESTPAEEDDTLDAEDMIETTIAGGLSIKNSTEYDIDVAEFIKNGPSIVLSAGAPQILIIHTHSSEAYTPAGLDKYEPTDTSRTEDRRFNIVRVGDELAEIFTECGLEVIHDREIYDYPSYTGSYTRSGEAVEKYLDLYPTVKIVIDVHRDAIGAGDVIYKTVAEEEGVCASQVMLLAGTDESGLEHPDWRDNVALALYLQKAVSGEYPTLMRPVSIVAQRYNQHLTHGSLILEVGSSGNTLREALAGARLFAQAAGPALCELIE